MFTFRALKTSNVRDRLSLRQGIKLAELGVLNAVGSTTIQYFRNLDRIIKLMPVNIMGLPWYKLKDRVDRQETRISKKRKDKKFLEGLAKDKHYLEGLIKKVSPSNNKAVVNNGSSNLATKVILNEAETALEFLKDRREFWSQQKPDYPKGPEEKKEAESLDKSPGWNTVAARVVAKPVTIFGLNF